MKIGAVSVRSWMAVCTIFTSSLANQVRCAEFTFDESTPFEYTLIESGYGGLQWNNFFIGNATNTGAFFNGMVSQPSVAFNGLGNPAVISNSAPFSLISAHLTAAGVSSLPLQVRGYAGTSLLYSNTYTLNGSGPSFVKFDYEGIDQVVFSGGMFTMDNLVIAVGYTNTNCTYGSYPPSREHFPGVAAGGISLFTDAHCPWSLVNTNPWITITSNPTHTGSQVVNYLVASNSTGLPRSGVITLADKAHVLTQFALAGTNLADLGNIQSTALGHRYRVSSLPRTNVTDYLIDQSQTSGGGGTLPGFSADFDEHDRFRLTVSAPAGKKFLVQPPAGASVRFVGSLLWQGNSTNGPSRFGTLTVNFRSLEGTAPDFSASRTVLSDYHGFCGFNEIESTAFTSPISFSAMILTATVPSLNIGIGMLNYGGMSGSLQLDYSTTQATDPGPFVFIVPAQPPTLSIRGQPNGDIIVIFSGVLESSSTIDGTFQAVPGDPLGTHIVPKANLAAPVFFRARN